MAARIFSRSLARFGLQGILFVGVLSSVLWPVRASGQGQGLLEQAKKEGEVVLYSTMPVSDFQFFEKAAKAKYPFLNIRHVRLSSASQVSRVMLEHKSGKVQADVIGNSLPAIPYYKEQGVLGRYESLGASQLIKGSADPDGYWAGITTDLLITAFNTKYLSKRDAPKGFDDYLNPKFKGQMAINRGVGDGLIGMMALRGEEQGIGYMKKLSQQELRAVEGFTHMTNLLAAGEYPIAIFMQVSKIEAMRRKGGPVDWLPTLPTLAALSAIALTRNAPHPAAARLLVDFYLSQEGQEGLVRAGKIPLRKGVKSPSKEIDEVLEGGNLFVLRMEGDYSRTMKLYNEILGVR